MVLLIFSTVFQNWPESNLVIVPDAGHSSKEEGTVHHLLEATDKYKTL